MITEYSIKEAVEMGALVEVFKDKWDELSDGKPIVASGNVFELQGRAYGGVEPVCILAETYNSKI